MRGRNVLLQTCDLSYGGVCLLNDSSQLVRGNGSNQTSDLGPTSSSRIRDQGSKSGVAATTHGANTFQPSIDGTNDRRAGAREEQPGEG